MLTAAIGTFSPGRSVAGGAPTRAAPEVDTALVVSIDVSNSVDEHRYKLQIEGIAAARGPRCHRGDPQRAAGRHHLLARGLGRPSEDRAAVDAHRQPQRCARRGAGDPRHAAPRRRVHLPRPDAALRVRQDRAADRPRRCASSSTSLGDGRDNCNAEEPIGHVRDELVASGVTINGLADPGGREAATLAPWYRDNVMGGPGAFEDFGRDPPEVRHRDQRRARVATECSKAARSVIPGTLGRGSWPCRGRPPCPCPRARAAALS